MKSFVRLKNVSVNFDCYRKKHPTLKEYFSGIFTPNFNYEKSGFAALNNVSLDIQSGERVAIIGLNGAGKSTLLKVISRILRPSLGTVEIQGRVAPLLEIGAGFHPEFSGRENLHFNGALLGYSKNDILQIESDVIDFAGLENFIDMPVKYYSSGMYMRLAFSLATAFPQKILILDEVFAGGDVEFLGKAANRMGDVIHQSEILIMVSHDLDLLKSKCGRFIWMDKGKIRMDGDVDEVLSEYKKIN